MLTSNEDLYILLSVESRRCSDSARVETGVRDVSRPQQQFTRAACTRPRTGAISARAGATSAKWLAAALPADLTGKVELVISVFGRSVETITEKRFVQ